MAEYLVEWYVPRTRKSDIRLEELRAAAERSSRDGTPVRLVRSIFLPEDELFLCLLDGPSAEAVRSVLDGAHLEVDRIAEAEPGEALPSHGQQTTRSQ